MYHPTTYSCMIKSESFGIVIIPTLQIIFETSTEIIMEIYCWNKFNVNYLNEYVMNLYFSRRIPFVSVEQLSTVVNEVMWISLHRSAEIILSNHATDIFSLVHFNLTNSCFLVRKCRGRWAWKRYILKEPLQFLQQVLTLKCILYRYWYIAF